MNILAQPGQQNSLTAHHQSDSYQSFLDLCLALEEANHISRASFRVNHGLIFNLVYDGVETESFVGNLLLNQYYETATGQIRLICDGSLSQAFSMVLPGNQISSYYPSESCEGEGGDLKIELFNGELKIVLFGKWGTFDYDEEEIRKSITIDGVTYEQDVDYVCKKNKDFSRKRYFTLFPLPSFETFPNSSQSRITSFAFLEEQPR